MRDKNNIAGVLSAHVVLVNSTDLLDEIIDAVRDLLCRPISYLLIMPRQTARERPTLHPHIHPARYPRASQRLNHVPFAKHGFPW